MRTANAQRTAPRARFAGGFTLLEVLVATLIMGIAISFGAPQIVAWVRGMFGV